jgi:hypothetical protein
MTQTATATATRESPIEGVALTTDFQATECKLASVERSAKGDSLTAKVALTIANLDPTQLYELGNIMEAGPLQVRLSSCQLAMDLK